MQFRIVSQIGSRGDLGLTFGLKTQGVTARTVTPRSSWLRGLDLNQRPLGYEGVGTVHRRRHRTKGAGSYAPPFRLVWSAVGRSTRKSTRKVQSSKAELPSGASGVARCSQRSPVYARRARSAHR